MAQSKPGFSFLVCPDSQLLRAHLSEQLAAFPCANGQWERHVYWGDEEPPSRFWEQLTLQGLFGTPRALVVRQAQLWPAAIWKKISQALGRPSAQCWPFFCLEVNWEKGQPKIPAHITKLRCVGFADRQGWIWRHEGLTERGIKRHVQQRAAVLRLSFEPDALEQFCAAVPPDALAIENELQKLTLLRNAARGRASDDAASGTASALETITAAMASTGSWSPECNIFACIRHMEAGNLAAVWKELARNRDNDSLLFSLLALLAREMRMLWQTWAGEKVRLHPSEAGFKRQLALRLGPRGLAEGMAAIMDAEWQVKSGRRTPEQSLEFLAARLTCLFAGQPRA